LDARGQTSLKTQGATLIAESALPLEEPAPENHFGPTDASKGRTGYAENDKTRQNRKKARQERQIKTSEANTK